MSPILFDPEINTYHGVGKHLGRAYSIGYVRSPLVDRKHAPKQGDEGAPEAQLIFKPVLDHVKER